ncbi:MAG: AraC family transcriptional regulator, partial [Lachnospiraceae bacterium]|nr:AraC family transcriptional regulator [Lachnospiraceae bacterium]
IMHYIEENYTSPGFSIKCMAAEFGTSPSNLSHQFKKLTGKTLSKFIDELRIAKAEEMLAGGEKIGVIALELGYSTTPVFTETYKRIRGITPSSFRSQYQKTGSIE